MYQTFHVTQMHRLLTAAVEGKMFAIGDVHIYSVQSNVSWIKKTSLQWSFCSTDKT